MILKDHISSRLARVKTDEPIFGARTRVLVQDRWFWRGRRLRVLWWQARVDSAAAGVCVSGAALNRRIIPGSNSEADHPLARGIVVCDAGIALGATLRTDFQQRRITAARWVDGGAQRQRHGRDDRRQQKSHLPKKQCLPNIHSPLPFLIVLCRRGTISRWFLLGSEAGMSACSWARSRYANCAALRPPTPSSSADGATSPFIWSVSTPQHVRSQYRYDFGLLSKFRDGRGF